MTCLHKPFRFPYISKFPPLYILKLLLTALKNQYNKVALVRVDEDGALAISSGFMRACHYINIIVLKNGGDEYSLNWKSES